MVGKRGETGDLGRSRIDCGEPEDPDAGDENTVLARLATVGAGDESRTSARVGSLSACEGELRTSAAGVTAADFALREGGRGRGLVRLDDARRSDNVGKPF